MKQTSKKLDSDWFVCRDKLAELEVGTVLEFNNGDKGLVIRLYFADPIVSVNHKAVLLIEFTSGEFWGEIAHGWLDVECRVVGRWRAGEQK